MAGCSIKGTVCYSYSAFYIIHVCIGVQRLFGIFVYDCCISLFGIYVDTKDTVDFIFCYV